MFQYASNDMLLDLYLTSFEISTQHVEMSMSFKFGCKIKKEVLRVIK